MWEIWANSMLSKALKSCPKSNKLPNLVTLNKNNKDRSRMSRIILLCGRAAAIAHWIRLRLPSCHLEVRISSTPSTLKSFIVKFVLYLSFVKYGNKQKETGFGIFFKKIHRQRAVAEDYPFCKR